MNHFRPPRSSPPLKPPLQVVAPSTPSTDHSRSSITSGQELSTLSKEEIDLIDVVIKRAGPSATTFLTVFKAYNDVLVERGLDPHEVVYYGKLLKLGTMKGKNWGEKWNAVKTQYHTQGSNGNSSGPKTAHARIQVQTPGPKSAPRRIPLRISSPSNSDDTFTLHSHENDNDSTSTEYARGYGHALQPNFRDLATGREQTSEPDSFPNTPSSRNTSRAIARLGFMSKDSESETSDCVPSIKPPSYQAANHSIQTVKSSHVSSQRRLTHVPPDEARKVVAMARERRGSVVNEEDAWKKIKMQRDEADAAQFRVDRLQERCWEVWRQGYYWIITTNRQIGEARDNLILRLSLQRWRALAMSRQDFYHRVTILSNRRILKRAVDTWKSRFSEKQRMKWRETMRMKMNSVKRKRDTKLLRDMWSRWCRTHYLQLSILQYTQHLQHRFYHLWKRKLYAIFQKEVIADNRVDRNVLERSWRLWRNAGHRCQLERTMVEELDLRLMRRTWLVWRKNLHDLTIAEEFYRVHLLKSAIRSWKASREQLLILEQRALKHVVRQDKVLVRAVARVWKARERGRLLERVRTTRLLQGAWVVWRNRVRQRKEDEMLALAFTSRSQCSSVTLSFRRWHDVYITHGNAHTFAAHYHTSQLKRKVILSWRIRLRQNLKLYKLSLRADEIFILRRGWKIWIGAKKAKIMDRLRGILEQRKIEKYFTTWLLRARGEKRRKMIEQLIEDHSTKRTLKRTLEIWTNRVIEMKLRELDVGQRRDHYQLSSAFKKWKTIYARHVEVYRLMESYQYVKREEITRLWFRRWLSLAASTRRRRIALQEREDEVRLSRLTAVWDRWRGRFIDEKLRPIEHGVILQSRRNLSFHAFGIWHSRTKSLPAIRFYTTNIRFKYFERWRRAMPKALQSKCAREMDRKAVYSRFMEKWLERVRTKRALRAVARARYLRLPDAVPRQTRPVTMGLPALGSRWPVATNRDHEFEGGRGSLDLPVKGRDPRPVKRRMIFGRGRGTSEVSPTRSVPGSVLSTKSEEVGRSNLWRELQEVQKKSGPPSARGRLG